MLRNRAHQPAFVRDRQRLDAALAAVRGRLGPAAADAALAEGARPSAAEAVAHARRVIRQVVGDA